MTHRPDEVRSVLDLVALGFNDCEIERKTGIPRRTVLDWRHRRLPVVRGGSGEGQCARCGHCKHDASALPAAEYAYLLGLYLGDGSISSHPRGVYRLRVSLDTRYPGIIEECQRAIAAVLPRNRVHVAWHVNGWNLAVVSACSKQWPCLFPQHGPGPKHGRRIELAPWQENLCREQSGQLLRGLIHSDGTRHLNTVRVRGRTYSYSRYNFTNASADIRGIFCKACDVLGIEWRRMNARNVSVARRASVAVLDRHVGPKA